MSTTLAYDFPDPDTGAQGHLFLSGFVWHGDVMVIDFSIPHYGVAGQVECDWRSTGPRYSLVQGNGHLPRTRDAVARLTEVLRPFFQGAYAGVTDAQLENLYRGDYHRGSGYTDHNPSPLDDQFKNEIADLVAALRPRKVLDAGCAAGALVQRLRARGIEAWGFDLCPDLADIALRDVAPFLRRGTTSAIPFGPEDGFDLLVCIDVFEHVPEDRVPAMVREFERLGVGTLAVHIAHAGLEHKGHITLRPLSWWDARLAPAFQRVPDVGGRVLQLSCPYDPNRVLRVYQRVGTPTGTQPRAVTRAPVPVAIGS